MKLIPLFLPAFILASVVSYQGFKLVSRQDSEPRVLSAGVSFETPTPSLTSTPTPTPSPALTPTLTLSLTPTVTPTPTPIPPPPVTSEQIHGFIERFAGQYGVDPNVLRHIAFCESGFNPLAVNGPYVGLYQFSVSAWQNNRVPMGEDFDPTLRYNAEESVQTTAYLLSIGKGHLWPNCQP